MTAAAYMFDVAVQGALFPDTPPNGEPQTQSAMSAVRNLQAEEVTRGEVLSVQNQPERDSPVPPDHLHALHPNKCRLVITASAGLPFCSVSWTTSTRPQLPATHTY